MSPITVILLVLGIIVLFFGLFALSAFIIKKKDTRKEMLNFEDGSSICVHTKDDCENCMVANKCVQRMGKGLLGFHKEE